MLKLAYKYIRIKTHYIKQTYLLRGGEIGES